MYEINERKRSESIVEASMKPAQIAALKKAYEPMRGKRISRASADKLDKLMNKFAKEKDLLIQILKADIPFVSTKAATILLFKHGMEPSEINKLKEEVELDEAKIAKKVPAKDGGYFVVLHRDTKGMRGTQDKFLMRILNKGKVKELGSHPSLDGALKFAKNQGIIEEVELDEKTKWKMGDGRPRGGSHIENERFWDLPKSSLEYIIKDAGEAMRLNPTARKATTGRGNWADQVNDAHTVLGWRRKNGIKEEVELDEDIMPLIFGGGIIAGLLPVLYLSAKEFAGPSIGKLVDKLKKNKNYKMSDSEKSDVKGFVSKVKKDKPSLLQKVMKKFKEEVELDEKKGRSPSARADAMKAMRRSGEFKDKDDDDIRATDADVKAASKNILMQMKSAADLSKGGEIEFLDKKKVKVPQKVAQLFVQKYMSLRRPADKAKFQEKAAKSYKDFVSAMKEEVESEHTILDRIHNKIQERKNV